MSASTAFVESPAKLNLHLQVGPVRRDGYHTVRTLLVALDGLHDGVTLTEADAVSIDCPGVDPQTNLARRAVDALQAHIGQSLPCHITIDKAIPMQAGLGGGSSNAAAVLVGLNHLFGLGLMPVELESIAADLGSDVPFFVRGGAQWATGRGEDLHPAHVPPFAAVIFKPNESLSTSTVYRAFDLLPPPPAWDESPVPDSYDDLVHWVRNDLWPAALSCAPRLRTVADRVQHILGADTALLCGSGSAIAGLYPTIEAAMQAATRANDAVAVVSPAGDGTR